MQIGKHRKRQKILGNQKQTEAGVERHRSSCRKIFSVTGCGRFETVNFPTGYEKIAAVNCRTGGGKFETQ
jgi:hypothetical protein